MAKTGDIEPIPSSSVPNATELKKELRRSVNKILEEEEYNIEIVDEIIRILTVLKELKLKNSSDDNIVVPKVECPISEGLNIDPVMLATGPVRGLLKNSSDEKSLKVGEDTVVPEEFKCPFSKEIMIDPVILATGQTYDRSFVLPRLNDGQRICPQTEQVLHHTFLTPNHLVRKIISKWCNEHGIDLPKPNIDDIVITGADRKHFDSLIEKMSSSLSDQKEAAKELRHLTKMMPSFRALFGESIDDIIPRLLNPLSPGKANTHSDLQEDLITTILNISVDENIKKPVAENSLVIPLLIESLKSGTMRTRSNAAAALFTLSALDSNKDLIGKSGALKPLIDLLQDGDLFAVKDAAAAIFNLCNFGENRKRAACEGAARVVIKRMKDGLLIDELLALLAVFSYHHKAIEDMEDLDTVSLLLSIIRNSTSERNKENAVAVLYTLCLNDRAKMNEIRGDELANGTISQLVETGTSRAKRKAKGILDQLDTA